MERVSNKKAKPTDRDIRAAAALKRLWKAMPKEIRPTQQTLADRYEETFGKGSQSVISQYMNGVIPLSIKTVMFFAGQFKCRVEDIYPDLPLIEGNVTLHSAESGQRARVAETVTAYGEQGDDADREWVKFSPEQKRRIMELVHMAELFGVTTNQDKDHELPARPRSNLKHDAPGADLRRQRRTQRKSGKRHVS